MQIFKKAICMFTAIITLLTSTPVIALCEEGISALNQPYSFSYEDESLSVEATITRDTVFTVDDETLKNDQIHLEGETDVSDVFSQPT